jgi:hypothetical protein
MKENKVNAPGGVFLWASDQREVAWHQALTSPDAISILPTWKGKPGRMPLKKLHELLNRDDPAWPIVKHWIAEATNPVEVLSPPDQASRERALVAVQVTTRSPMGAIVYETGGILVDHGWLRILASGHARLPRSVADWNFGRSYSVSGQQPAFLLIADDVVGGFFAIDGGALGMKPGHVCYHAPDTLAWEDTGKGYSDFIGWCFGGDLEKYYGGMRWPTWREEVAHLAGDQAFGIYPFLSVDGPPITERSRQVTSIAELYERHVGKAQPQ